MRAVENDCCTSLARLNTWGTLAATQSQESHPTMMVVSLHPGRRLSELTGQLHVPRLHHIDNLCCRPPDQAIKDRADKGIPILTSHKSLEQNREAAGALRYKYA